jgi:phosphohistidine swiveling domain-containing protein
MLKSLVKENLITQETYDAFYNSIETVASDINNDFNALLQEKISKQEFLKKYGHLRPGTYDITSQRYENNPQLLKTANLKIEQKKKQTYFITKEQEETITNVLLSHNISITSTQFLTFAEQATKARELSKFEFTKNLSDALEYIAKAGEDLGFTRKEIAMLNIHDILHVPSQDRIKIWKEKIKEQENKKMITDKIILPSIILTEKDFEIIQHYDSRPNYITQKNITAEIIHLKNIEEQHHKIEGNIVILENGDPGYDWIFTRNPAGLITKYGGVASHMSIRCAEFGIPAAIGCGEKIFNQLQTSSQIILNCKDNKIIIL